MAFEADCGASTVLDESRVARKSRPPDWKNSGRGAFCTRAGAPRLPRGQVNKTPCCPLWFFGG